MNLRRVEERLIKIKAGDKKELGRLMRDMGHELNRNREEVLRSFRSLLAENLLGNLEYDGKPVTKDFVDGACFALREIAAAYEAAMEGVRYNAGRKYNLSCENCMMIAQSWSFSLEDLWAINVIRVERNGEIRMHKHFDLCEKWKKDA